MRVVLEWLLLLGAAQEPKEAIVFHTAEELSAASFPALALPEGELGLVVGGLSADVEASGWKDLLSSARWGVVNLGWRDKPSGAPDELPAISANVPGSTRGFLIQELRGKKIAFVGVSAPPPGQGRPGLEEPLAALQKTLPQVRADLVVLVADLSRDRAWALLRGVPGVHLCISSGRGSADPEPLRMGESWILEAPPRGAWGRVGIALDAQGRIAAVTNRFEAPSGVPSEAVAAAKKRHGLPMDPVGDIREGANPGRAQERIPIRQGENRACRLRILSDRASESYGSLPPAPGRRLIVLDAEFENIIPLSLVQSHEVPVQYRIPNLADHLYLLANGTRVWRLRPEAGQLPGHVPVREFNLERLGSKIRGNLVFDAPFQELQRLEIRFYDFAHGHMTIPISGRPGDAGDPDAKPRIPLESNEILEVGVFDVRRADSIGVKKAPPGMAYLAVELRARSRMTTPADASAFDPKARPKEKIEVGTVADWKESRRHLNLVVDGEYAYPSTEESELPEEPRFLPDVLAGGGVVFLVPQGASSMELRCDFPNAALPGGRTIRPRPVTFLLEGKRPEAPRRDAVVEIDDQIFKVAIVGQSLVREFAQEKPGPGQAFLLLDLTVRNTGLATESFQTRPQLKYATEKGQTIELHPATFRGPRRPGELVLVPPGEPRSFQVLFAIPESDRRPRLLYAGVSKAATVILRPLEPAASEAKKRLCPKCGREAGPKDKFCDACGTKLGP